MSKVLQIVCVLMVWGLGAAPQTPAEELELELSALVSVEQSRKPSTDPLAKAGSEVVTVMLRNKASETITAWKVSCLQAENDGNYGVGSLEVDSFLELGLADSSVLIEPGETRQVSLPVGAWQPTEPYVAIHCGVTAVVLADASYAGMRSEVRRIFTARTEMLSEVLEAAEIVDQLIKTGVPSKGKRSFRDRDLAETIRIAEAAAQSEGNTMRLQRTFQSLRDRADRIAEHLPSGWTQLNAKTGAGTETAGVEEGDR